MMRVLVFTTLYPNAAMPAHGVFVENRLRAFLDRHDADVRVVAPVPWFPFRNAAFGRYGRWAQTPLQESRRGIDVYHPRYFIPPKAGMTAAPYALARCLKRIVQRFQAEGWDFDLIDAHYLYPDSVAAARIAHETGKPVVITARGSDVTLLPRFAGPRNAIVETSLRADAIIAVAKGLKAELLKLGASEKKVTVLRNGVDLEMFRPVDRDLARRAMNLDGPVIASIGHLIDRKGHDIIIDALSMLPDATLLVVGAGEQRTRLKRRARTAGIAGRVRFLSAVAHDSLRD
ncbi:MAG: glycosyltransferase, partial [Hyphococcus sp.]